MKPSDPKTELLALIEETTTALGATDQLYIRFLQMVQQDQKLSLPTRLFQGQLIFFKYKPVSKSHISRNTYYDSFPLVLVTNVYRGGFEGVNLHFLGDDFRKYLFDSVMRDLPTIKGSQEWRSRLLIDYDRLAARKKFRFFKPCYRSYLWKGMKRRPVVVPFDMWEEMVNHSVGRFREAKPEIVYIHTRKKIVQGKT